MSEFSFRAGEEMTLWVKDRSNLSAFLATTAFQNSLAQVGVPCVLRGCNHLPTHCLYLNHGETPTTIEEISETTKDAFQTRVDGPDGVVLVGNNKRGLIYGIWNLLELLGWSWPTPSLERTPEVAVWTLSPMAQTSVPALTHRIVFLEEVQVTPEILVWLSKQRINTLFPSNPSRFSEPEIQFSDACMSRATELGLDFIIGGAWWDWLGTGLEKEKLSDSSGRVVELANRAVEMWEGMGEPAPRVSLWPLEENDEFHLNLLNEIAIRNDSLLFETVRDKDREYEAASSVLHQVIDPEWVLNEPFESMVTRLLTLRGGPGTPVEDYLSISAFSDDGHLGFSVSAFLWPCLLDRMKAASAAGFSGASLEFRSLPLGRFLESSGFAVSVVARGMWHGSNWDESLLSEKTLRDQFDLAGGIVSHLVDDFSDWARKSKPHDRNGDEHSAYPFLFAGEILRSERVRDKLDERISEIEESPPCEPSLELLRNLTTLVNLYDLEQTEDIHEAAATARTIWKKNEIDSWPEWLRKGSPLVERLAPYL